MSGDHRRPAGRFLIALADAAFPILAAACALVVLGVVLFGVVWA